VARGVTRASAVPRTHRNVAPIRLESATRFSEENGAFFDPVALVRLAKSVAPVRRELESAVVNHGHGPKRADGFWALIFLAFVMGREPNLQPWYRMAASNTTLWDECGFASVPAYQTVWQRFAELEGFAEVFCRARDHLIDLARRREARIGMFIAMDGTESQTHSQPKHACGPNDDCPTRGHKREPRLRSVSADEAITLRQHDAEIEEVSDDEPTRPSAPGLDPVEKGLREMLPDGRLMESCGHYWHSKDTSAGTRQYKRGKGRGKVFHGFINNKAVDVATGAVVSILCTPADVNEATAFPDLYEMTRQAVGCDPVAILTDRGYVTDAVAAYCTERDVTQVAPYRKHSGGSPARQMATARIDEHNAPRCRHCGLSGDFVRFAGGPDARIWFRCPLPTTAGCLKVQSIMCSEAPRRLKPLWKTSEVYSALRSQMSVREHAHEDYRTYFRSGGKNLRERQRRKGVECQQLRANAAILIQWIWLLVRQGWLGSRPERDNVSEIRSGGYLERMRTRRAKAGLLGGSYPAPRAIRAGSAPPIAAPLAA